MRTLILAALVFCGGCPPVDVAGDGETPQEAALSYAQGVEGATSYHCEGRLLDVDGWIPCLIYRGDLEPLAIECRARFATGEGCRPAY